MMYVVGLTGGIASGKSEVSRKLAELGVPVIDTDVIAHQLTSTGHPVLKQIITSFGDHYLSADGSFNRAAMRQKVFEEPAARLQLEAILHPAIYEKVVESLKQSAQAPYQVIVVPLLFESEHYRKLVKRTLLVDCDESLQISRATHRGVPPDLIKAIMQVQMPRTERLKLADNVIVNNGTLEELHQQVEDIHKNYMHACIVSD
jgi:dephospho-CoA kinase